MWQTYLRLGLNWKVDVKGRASIARSALTELAYPKAKSTDSIHPRGDDGRADGVK